MVCRAMKADRQATEARHFANKKSYVAKDGREVLYGNDWKQRKAELWARASGRCEQHVPKTEQSYKILEMAQHTTFMFCHPSYFERCRSEGHDPHHVTPRSKGRDDRLDNLILLCRMHHDLLDKRKPRWTRRS